MQKETFLAIAYATNGGRGGSGHSIVCRHGQDSSVQTPLQGPRPSSFLFPAEFETSEEKINK